MNQDLERWMRRFQPPRPPAGLRRRIFGEATETPDAGTAQATLVDDRRDAVIAGIPAVVPTSRPTSRTSTARNSFWRFAAASTAATAVVLLVLVVLATAPRNTGLADRDRAGNPPNQQALPVPAANLPSSEASASQRSQVVQTPTSEAQKELVACVIGFESITWQDETQSYEMHQRLSPGDRINIKNGRLKLVFDCGVQMVLEGPAELEVLGKKRIRMSTGIITARGLGTEEKDSRSTPRKQMLLTSAPSLESGSTTKAGPTWPCLRARSTSFGKTRNHRPI